MRALIADDDRTTTAILSKTLQRWGIDVIVVADGAAAWDVLTSDDNPTLAILDWMMPGLDGLEICRRLRQDAARAHIYVILLSGRDSRADIVAGLEAGADDYLIKPFDPGELRARVHVGIRVVTLQTNLAQRVGELQDALSKVRQLRGLLPICSYCKRIRTDENYWQQVDGYIAEHSEVQFSHGICPTCYETVSAEFER
jgi:sigma-B regulation protein RsbU (phosphoserine phosphatase)